MQAPGPGLPSGDYTENDPCRTLIQLEPPGPQRVFRLESEEALKERIRQERRQCEPPERITFPDEPVLSKERYAGRAWPKMLTVVEPHYVCYGRLHFEQRNFERYGWDLGIISPLVAAGGFYGDFLTLPYHIGSHPCRWWDCSAGYCLPGDPTPLLLYPPEVTVTGTLAETAVVGTLLAIFP
jgi:hypothetical protein